MSLLVKRNKFKLHPGYIIKYLANTHIHMIQFNFDTRRVKTGEYKCRYFAIYKNTQITENKVLEHINLFMTTQIISVVAWHFAHIVI